MTQFETIHRGGHTYKRRKGSRDRWIDERGNVVDLTNGTRTVTTSSSKRIGSGDNSANPDVWIANGKAYKDNSHGGYKTSYYNAVKKLGQNLGWNVTKGSASEAALKSQNKLFNNSKTKLASGKIGQINNAGNATVLQSPKSNKKTGTQPTQDQPESGKTADTFMSGLKLIGGGLEDAVGALTDNNSSFARNFVRLGGGLGRAVQGLGQATVGTLSSAILPESWQQNIAKYGQIANFGKVANTVAEGIQGRIMTPWDERNTGLLSRNFDWMGSAQDRQDVQDFYNGLLMVVGAKGAGAGLKSTISGVKSGTRLFGKTPKPYEAPVILDEEVPLVVTTPPSGVQGYSLTPKITIIKGFPKEIKSLEAPENMVVPNLKRLPYNVEATIDDAGSASKALPTLEISPNKPALEAAPKITRTTTSFPAGFRLDTSTIFPKSSRSSAFNYVKGVQNAFKKAGISYNMEGLKNYALRFRSNPYKYRITNADELAAMRQEFNFRQGGNLYRRYFI